MRHRRHGSGWFDQSATITWSLSFSRDSSSESSPNQHYLHTFGNRTGSVLEWDYFLLLLPLTDPLLRPPSLVLRVHFSRSRHGSAYCSIYHCLDVRRRCSSSLQASVCQSPSGPVHHDGKILVVHCDCWTSHHTSPADNIAFRLQIDHSCNGPLQDIN